MAAGSWIERVMGAWRTRAASLPPPAGAPASPPLVSAYEDVSWLAGWPTADAQNDRGVRPMRVFAQTRWDPAQADEVLRAAEQGQFQPLATMLDAMRRDGIIAGILRTRTSGMLRCPVKFTGDPWLCEQLRGRDPVYDAAGALIDPGSPGVFWDMFPESEQASIIWDGIMAGVGIGELVPRPGRAPRLRHLPLHFLHYRFETDFYYYQSVSGAPWAVTIDSDDPPVASNPPLPTPRGRFVLFTPYGRERPWMKGSWWPSSLPFIQRQNVVFDSLRWQQNLADPLKWIEAQEGADERHRTWLMKFVNFLWRRAAGLVTPPKYRPQLVESNGRGYEVYQQAYDQAGTDLQIALAGSKQIVTGGTAFSNMSIQRDISADLTNAIAEAWSTCLHEQGIRPWVASIGQQRSRAPWARWDVRAPEQRKADAEALGSLAVAVDAIDVTLARRGRIVDLDALLEESGQAIPTRPLPPGVAAPPLATKDEPAASEPEAEADASPPSSVATMRLRRVA